MALFITYASYSPDGIKGLMAKPEDRTAAIGKLAAKVGAKVVALYNTTGSNDVVVVTEGASVSDAAAISMAVSASGAIARVETVSAWTGADFAAVAKKAGSLTGAYTPPGG